MKTILGIKGTGDIEETQNARLKLVTFNYELGLESDWFCILSHSGEHLTKNCFRVKEIWSRHEMHGSNM